jgi:hypothetical protein
MTTSDTKPGLTRETRDMLRQSWGMIGGNPPAKKIILSLLDALDAAEAERDHWKHLRDLRAEAHVECAKALEAAEERERVLKETLTWYAEHADKWALAADKGERAREALATTKEGE